MKETATVEEGKWDTVWKEAVNASDWPLKFKKY
jgi:hypothetical protein